MIGLARRGRTRWQWLITDRVLISESCVDNVKKHAKHLRLVSGIFGAEVSQLLDTMLMLADQNAQEIRERRWSHRAPAADMTAALIEKQEWDAFRAKLQRRKALLLKSQNDEADDALDVDVDEDDLDMLLTVVDVLDAAWHSKSSGLTVSDVVRALQRNKVLSVEFTASARAQTKRLLTKLRQMNRAWQDAQGRWALL